MTLVVDKEIKTMGHLKGAGATYKARYQRGKKKKVKSKKGSHRMPNGRMMANSRMY